MISLYRLVVLADFTFLLWKVKALSEPFKEKRKRKPVGTHGRCVRIFQEVKNFRERERGEYIVKLFVTVKQFSNHRPKEQN